MWKLRNVLCFVETVRELLSHIPATVKSDAPTGISILGELGTESGMTPLHLAAYSGNENVVRLLLNSVGVQVEAVTNENVKWIFSKCSHYTSPPSPSPSQ